MARNPVQFQTRNQPQRVPLALWNRTAVLRRPVPMALAQRFRVPELRPRPRLPLDHTQAPAVLSLQSPDLHHRRHPLRGHQAASHGVAPGHRFHDPGQEGVLCDDAAPPTWHLLQRRMAHAPQADAGEDGARPRAPARRVHPARRCLSRGRAQRRQARAGAPGKTPFVAAVETHEAGHPRSRASVSPKSPPGRSST